MGLWLTMVDSGRDVQIQLKKQLYMCMYPCIFHLSIYLSISVYWKKRQVLKKQMRVSKQTTSFLLPLWPCTTPISIPLPWLASPKKQSLPWFPAKVPNRGRICAIFHGCERQEGNMFCWGLEEMGQGLGRQALDILDILLGGRGRGSLWLASGTCVGQLSFLSNKYHQIISSLP